MKADPVLLVEIRERRGLTPDDACDQFRIRSHRPPARWATPIRRINPLAYCMDGLLATRHAPPVGPTTSGALVDKDIADGPYRAIQLVRRSGWGRGGGRPLLRTPDQEPEDDRKFPHRENHRD